MTDQSKNTNRTESAGTPVPELVAHFREKRELLRRQWVEQMMAKGLLTRIRKLGSTVPF